MLETIQCATLPTLDAKLSSCILFSDAMNHASMIQSICHSGAKYVISKYNDLLDLEAKLKQHPKETHKIVTFESIKSMCNSVGPIKKTCDLAKQYGAPTFLSEVCHIENDRKVFILNINVSGLHCWPVQSP